MVRSLAFGELLPLMASYRAVPIDGTIRLDVHGTLDLGASRALLLEIARDAHLKGHGLLVDLRQAHGALSYRDVHDLVGVLTEHPDAFRQRVALLEDYGERFEKAQFFQAYAQERGFEARAFVDEARAVAWLEEGEG